MSKKTILIIIMLIAVIVLIILTRLFNSSEKTLPLLPVLTAPSSAPKNAPQIPPGGAGYESEEFKEAEIKYIKEHPILQKLPVKSPFFGIEYISEEQLVVISKTEDKERDYQFAKNWFVENDIDINKISVEYK